MKRTRLSRFAALTLLPAGLTLAGAHYGAVAQPAQQRPGDPAASGGPAVVDSRSDTQRSDGGLSAAGAAMNAETPAHAPRADTRGAAGSRADTPHIPQNAAAFWGSDLIGLNVAIAGERDAEIEDVVVNVRTGDAPAAVTRITGLRGEERLYAVPLDMFQVEANRLALKVDRNWFVQRKSWSDDGWPDLRDDAAFRDLADGGSVKGRGPYHRLSRLLDRGIENAEGGTIGELKDAALNMKAKKVEFVLVEHDPGWLSLGNEYAFPLSAFDFPAAANDGASKGTSRIVLDIGRNELKSMKPVSRDDYKRINDRGWIGKIKSVF